MCDKYTLQEFKHSLDKKFRASQKLPRSEHKKRMKIDKHTLHRGLLLRETIKKIRDQIKNNNT